MRRRSKHADGAEQDKTAHAGVSLRQRVWPVIDMLERAQGAGQPIVWGV
ncbi:MAG TPA: DUF1840 family protein [Rubrivivax sp.]|nr:DUF1840 family protein [Rubrivivax sp.]